MRRKSTLNHYTIPEIVNILQLPLKERMSQDIQRLCELTQNLPLFESLKKSGQLDAHYQICSDLNHKTYRENEVILTIGQHAQSFQVILSGQVGVYVRQKRKDQVQKEEQLFLVKTLGQGDWFGEVGMVHNQASLVNYVCLTETQTATLDKKKFKNILDQFFLIRMTFQLNFLREIPLFWGWSENDMRILYQVYSRQKFIQEEPVYLQGDVSQYIYIVKEGQFRIFKHFDELRIRKYYDQNFKQQLDQDKYHTKAIREFEEEKNLQVGTIERNEMFGEEDILTKRNRKYSVVCESDYGELYVFTKSAMSCLIMNQEKSKNYILARFKNKQNSYSKRLDNISQYISSVKIDVIEKNQDQLRMTEDFLSTRPSKIMDQQSMIQSMKTLTKLSDSKYGTMRNQSGIKNSIRIDLPQLNNNSAQNLTFYRQPSNQENQLSSSRTNNFNNEDKNNLLLSRTQVNFKSLNNLNSNDSLVNTQYFTNQSQQQIGAAGNYSGLQKGQAIYEKRRKNYMQKYYDQFKFNVVDKNYCNKIIDQCTDIGKEYSNNKIYAKGAFNNKLGQRGFRCLGIDEIKDTNQEYERAKLKIQEEFDPDYKIKNLNHSSSLKK
ncbi:hypothetical protein ABPG74_017693 [Tetrahymena malaccensis]